MNSAFELWSLHVVIKLASFLIGSHSVVQTCFNWPHSPQTLGSATQVLELGVSQHMKLEAVL